MKAAVYYETGRPDVFRCEERPDPVCPPDGVLIEVKAVSIEGGDTLNRAGGPMPATPHIVGYQCAGVVREAGPQVTDRNAGDRVVAFMPFGSHAALVAVPARQTWLVPDGLDIKTASAVPVAWGTAHDCLFEFGKLQKGETVLIQAGAGGVGLAAIQLAKRAGATVLATASSDEKLARLKDFGLDHGVNYREGDWVAKVRELTNGRGVDLAVDSVGGGVLQGSIESLCYRGRAITVGNAGRDQENRPDLSALSGRNASLTGVFLGAEALINTARVAPMIGGLLQEIADGKLKVVIDSTYPLSEAAAAHAHIESRKAFGRVLLIP